MTIDKIIDRIYPLAEDSKLKLKNTIKEVSFSKGYILIQAEKIETSIFFIKSGIIRAYAETKDKDVTFWFGTEGDVGVSLNSYVQNMRGYENIELLEDCHFYEIKIEELRRLFVRDINIANWGRKFAERELIKTEERLISRQFSTAMERYKKLLEYNPQLLRRVQLRYIASYLGITQVSLSRIRADIK